MKSLKKWILNADAATLVLGALLMYFAEDIVLFFMPLEPLPSGIISILLYLTLFTVACFWAFKGLVYLTIKLYWNIFYDYLEFQFKKDFANLKPLPRVCIAASFYCFLFLVLAIIFHAAVSAL